MKDKQAIKEWILQRLMGIGLLFMSYIVPLVNDYDATIDLIFVPLGLWLIFTRENAFHYEED